jgi:hypothetical protein
MNHNVHQDLASAPSGAQKMPFGVIWFLWTFASASGSALALGFASLISKIPEHNLPIYTGPLFDDAGIPMIWIFGYMGLVSSLPQALLISRSARPPKWPWSAGVFVLYPPWGDKNASHHSSSRIGLFDPNKERLRVRNYKQDQLLVDLDTNSNPIFSDAAPKEDQQGAQGMSSKAKRA